jgi:hypothetical protein
LHSVQGPSVITNVIFLMLILMVNTPMFLLPITPSTTKFRAHLSGMSYQERDLSVVLIIRAVSLKEQTP